MDVDRVQAAIALALAEGRTDDARWLACERERRARREAQAAERVWEGTDGALR